MLHLAERRNGLLDVAIIIKVPLEWTDKTIKNLSTETQQQIRLRHLSRNVKSKTPKHTRSALKGEKKVTDRLLVLVPSNGWLTG